MTAEMWSCVVALIAWVFVWVGEYLRMNALILGAAWTGLGAVGVLIGLLLTGTGW